MKNPPYVHEFMDRFGNVRRYFRRAGFPRVPLPGLPWSPEFMAAHEAALKGGKAPIGADRTKAGSVDAAMVGYYGSDHWKTGLAEASRKMRRPILERFRVQHGDKRIAKLLPEHIHRMLEKGTTRDSKKNWLKAVRGLFGFCVANGLMTSDPTSGIRLPRPARRSSGHMTWFEEQIEQYRARHPLGTMARLALELMLNVAARRQDACVLGRQHEKSGKLTWRPKKTLGSTGKILSVRILPRLRAAIDAMPASDAMTYLTNDYGQPFASAAAFGNKFADWCVQAGLASIVCDDGRTRSFRAHGLRKASCRQLAHDGCSAAEIQAVSGHATLAQLQVYINEVDQERLADSAMDKHQKGVERDKTETNIGKLDVPVCQSMS